MICAWALRLMLALAAREHPAATWAGTYAATAAEIAQATQDPGEVALLVAVSWYEARFWPNAPHGGRWQTSAHWGAPTAATALRLVRESQRVCGPGLQSLAWYHWGSVGCARYSPASPLRVRLAAELLRDYPPPDVM